MMRVRGIQSVRSPTIRWPRMSNALQVSFPSLRPSLRCTQISGRPRKSAFRVAGVRERTAMVAGRLNSVGVALGGEMRRGGGGFRQAGADDPHSYAIFPVTRLSLTVCNRHDSD